jgi:hypothetical protein
MPTAEFRKWIRGSATARGIPIALASVMPEYPIGASALIPGSD